MTLEQFRDFAKDKKISLDPAPKDSQTVYYDQEPYHDVHYKYCYRTNTIYQERFYIGD